MPLSILSSSSALPPHVLCRTPANVLSDLLFIVKPLLFTPENSVSISKFKDASAYSDNVVVKSYVKHWLKPLHREQVETEVQLLSCLSHDHIAPLLAAVEDANAIHLIMPWCDGGDLRLNMQGMSVVPSTPPCGSSANGVPNHVGHLPMCVHCRRVLTGTPAGCNSCLPPSSSHSTHNAHAHNKSHSMHNAHAQSSSHSMHNAHAQSSSHSMHNAHAHSNSHSTHNPHAHSKSHSTHGACAHSSTINGISCTADSSRWANSFADSGDFFVHDQQHGGQQQQQQQQQQGGEMGPVGSESYQQQQQQQQQEQGHCAHTAASPTQPPIPQPQCSSGSYCCYSSSATSSCGAEAQCALGCAQCAECVHGCVSCMPVLSPAEERLRSYLLQPLLSALSLLEQQGIVHRDISPKNILVHQGRVVLSDLGMAVRMLPLGVHQPPHTEERAAGNTIGPSSQPQQADACSSIGTCTTSSSGSSCSSGSLCSTLGSSSGCCSSNSCGCSSVCVSAFAQATHQPLPPNPPQPLQEQQAHHHHHHHHHHQQQQQQQQPLLQERRAVSQELNPLQEQHTNNQQQQQQQQQPLPLQERREVSQELSPLQEQHTNNQQQQQQQLPLQERRAVSQELNPLQEQHTNNQQQPLTQATLVARNHVAPPLLQRTRSSPELMSSVSGTPLYAAPEVLQAVFSNKRVENTISPKNDVWALGVIAMEALTGRHPFSQGGINGGIWRQDPNILFSISSGKPLQLPPQLSPACADLLTRMLQRDPARRPYASELLHHPFFSCQAGTSAPNRTEEASLGATPCMPPSSRAYAQKHRLGLPPLPPTQVA